MFKDRHIILAPHLDDEIIGCYSILDKVDEVVYFTDDYRSKDALYGKIKYTWFEDFNFNNLKESDTIYLPSKYDFHPLHKQVRNKYINLNCKKMFYNVEMNVPWLEEETDGLGKLELLKMLYPKEDLFIKNDKYWIFKSIKEYDDIEYEVLYFNNTTHKFQLNISHSISEQEIKIILSTSHFLCTPKQVFYMIQNRYPTAIIELNVLDNNNKIIKIIK